MKILFVFGTRPEAIKMAPLVRLARRRPSIETRVCVTGQHREMLDQVLQFFSIEPDYDLAVMRENQDLSGVASRTLEGLRPILRTEAPDLVVVQGDTISAMAGGLAAFFERVPVAHVEAGLRTYNLHSPFPEEGLRQLITRIAALHFAPTLANAAALEREGVDPQSIYVTGNPGIDAVLWTRDLLAAQRAQPPRLELPEEQWQAIENARRIVLVTAHRRENFGSGMQELCRAIRTIAERHPDLTLVFPVHPNPSVRGPVYESLRNCGNVVLTIPLTYPSFVYLMNRCQFLISDSGGVQEEAPALGKQVIVTRSCTERGEAMEQGLVALAGTDCRMIIERAEQLLSDKKGVSLRGTPFGDGRAAEKILAILESWHVKQRESAELVTQEG